MLAKGILEYRFLVMTTYKRYVGLKYGSLHIDDGSVIAPNNIYIRGRLFLRFGDQKWEKKLETCCHVLRRIYKLGSFSLECSTP